MSSLTRLLKTLSTSLFPVFILLVVVYLGLSVYLAHSAANPPKVPYIVTPEKYGMLSTRAAKVTDEKWQNKDGSQTRAWLLRGTEGAPAVILLHRFGADRSWVLDLGVKMNETTDFTILMPDMRGHGENPSVPKSFFGGSEKDDVKSAIEFLRSLKSESGQSLVGPNLGVFGVELGAEAGMLASVDEAGVKALALDSIPRSSDDIIGAAIDRKFPFLSPVTGTMAKHGAFFYFASGGYDRQQMCDVAKTLTARKIMVLAGVDVPEFQAYTSEVSECFPNPQTIERKTDLNPSAYNINNGTLEQTEAYDQRVIDFFKRNL